MACCSWLASVGGWAPTLGQKWHIPVLFKVLNHSFTWPQEIHDYISCWYLPEHVKHWGHIFLPHNLHNKWFKMNCVCIAGLQKSYSLHCLSQLCITWFFSPQKSTCLLHVWQCFPIGGKFYFLEKTQPRVHPVTYRVIFAINSRFFFFSSLTNSNYQRVNMQLRQCFSGHLRANSRKTACQKPTGCPAGAEQLLLQGWTNAVLPFSVPYLDLYPA